MTVKNILMVLISVFGLVILAVAVFDGITYYRGLHPAIAMVMGALGVLLTYLASGEIEN